MKKILFGNLSILFALVLGLILGFLNNDFIYQVATFTTTIFIKLLKLIGIPIVFLSLVSNIAGMKSLKELKILGRKIFSYAILTTIIAASVALILFLIIKPSHANNIQNIPIENSASYLSFLIEAVPDNFLKAFVNNNVIAVAFLGILMGLAILFLPKENKNTLHHFFSSFFLAFLKITKFIIALMPIGIMAFVCIFIKEISQNTQNLKDLILYTTCVVGANLIQGFLILPLFLKFKKISPIKTFKSMSPCTNYRFFHKIFECSSSNLHKMFRR
ncbi:MAG: C4-dicarboxylate transport protein [Candidatus Anoxychlamydiales bacterium]|nr:C4-dicarboxylate transport protein [Candidatus Anoxychlamydiales bacterium]